DDPGHDARRRRAPRRRAAGKSEAEPRHGEGARRRLRRLPARGGLLLEPEDPAPALPLALPPPARVFGAVADLRSAELMKIYRYLDRGSVRESSAPPDGAVLLPPCVPTKIVCIG